MKKNWPAIVFLAVAALVACVYAWMQFDEGDSARNAEGEASAAAARPAPGPAPVEAEKPATDEAPEPPTPEPIVSERVETPRKSLVEGETVAAAGRVLLPANVPPDEVLEVLAFSRADGAQRRATDTAEHELEELEHLLARTPVRPDGAFEIDLPAAGDAWLALRGRYCYAAQPEPIRADARSKPVRIEALVGGRVIGRLIVPRGVEAESLELDECDLELQFNELRAAGLQGALSSARLREHRTHADPQLRFEFRAVPAPIDYDLRLRPEGLAAFKSARFTVSVGRTVELEAPLTIGGSLRGKVVDPNGAGVADVELVARIDPAMFGQGGYRVRSAKSSADGSFALEHVTAGEVNLRADARGYLETDAKFLVEDGQAQRDIVLELDAGSSIAGRVSWPDGRAAGNVEVRVGFDVTALGGMGAFNAMQGADGKAHTDDEGRFVVQGLGKGPFTVRTSVTLEGASATDDDVSAWTARADHVQPDGDELALVLGAPRFITGRVLDAAGQPVASYSVSAREQLGGMIPGLGGQRRKREIDDAEGRFEIAGASPGLWLVDAHADGYTRSAAVEVEVPAEGDAAPIELVLHRGGTVSGSVRTPDGATIAGAQVTLKVSVAELMRNMRVDEERGATGAPSAKTDRQGRFRLENIEPGERLIVARHEQYAESAPLNVEVRSEEEIVEAELTLRRGGRILGKIYDKEGQPFPGASILVQLAADPLLQRFVESDANGEFIAAPMAEGTWNVIHMPSSRSLPSDGGDTSEMMSFLGDMLIATANVVDGQDVEVTLGAPPKDPVVVHGEVRHGGKGVAGVLVTFIADGNHGMEAMKFTTTDSGGRYKTTLRQPGRYLANIQKLGESGEQQTVTEPVDVPATSEHRADFKLPGGAIRGRVFDPSGAPASRARVTLFVDGPVPNATLIGERYSEITTDANGAYSLDWLAAGRYTVAVGGAPFGGMFGSGGATSGRQVRDGVVVRDGEIVEGVDFELRKPGRIAGVVRNSNGAPAAEASIFLRDDSGRPLERFSMVATDAAGKFAYDGVEPGTYTVIARTKEEVSVESAPVRVRDDAVGDVSLTLAPGTILLVSLSDDENESVDCSVEVLDDQGRQVNGMMSMADLMEAFSKGLFSSKEQRVGPLPPGRYRVIVKANDGRSATKPVTLTGQPERKLNIRL